VRHGVEIGGVVVRLGRVCWGRTHRACRCSAWWTVGVKVTGVDVGAEGEAGGRLPSCVWGWMPGDFGEW